MRFGICTAIENADAVRQAGWDFVEELVQRSLQGHLADSQWQGEQRIRSASLPVPVANSLIPAAMKLTGPERDLNQLTAYMSRVLSRAGQLGISTLVFGSGAARTVPDGFDREAACRQILDFLKMSCPLAAKCRVTIVAEHLNRGECNIINSVAEAMEYVREIDHPNFRCLVDSYHFWLENESLDSLRDAMPWIRHVHLADTADRVSPGESGANDYRPFFSVLKEGGYQGSIAIEPRKIDIPMVGPRVLAFLRREWNAA